MIDLETLDSMLRDFASVCILEGVRHGQNTARKIDNDVLNERKLAVLEFVAAESAEREMEIT